MDLNEVLFLVVLRLRRPRNPLVELPLFFHLLLTPRWAFLVVGLTDDMPLVGQVDAVISRDVIHSGLLRVLLLAHFYGAHINRVFVSGVCESRAVDPETFNCLAWVGAIR